MKFRETGKFIPGAPGTSCFSVPIEIALSRLRESDNGKVLSQLTGMLGIDTNRNEL
jgi:hypothetical protein